MTTIAEANKEDPKPWYQATGFYTEGISDVEHIERFMIPFSTKIGAVMLDYWSKQNPANLLKTHVIPTIGDYDHVWLNRLPYTDGKTEEKRAKIKDMEVVGLAMDIETQKFWLYLRNSGFQRFHYLSFPTTVMTEWGIFIESK